jgi:hypothetical protein
MKYDWWDWFFLRIRIKNVVLQNNSINNMDAPYYRILNPLEEPLDQVLSGERKPHFCRDYEELEKAQKAIEEMIFKHAQKQGLSNEDCLPITDGVCSIEGYLKSHPKIMWVLKEPVDEIADGRPLGGGWSITKDCIGDKEKYKKNMAVRTWRRMIYINYGYLHGLRTQELEIVRENWEIAKVLEDIAYINVSKMPGMPTSQKTDLWKCYSDWKPILEKQLEIYDPDVIIFGNTFQYFESDFKRKGLESIGMIGGFNCFKKNSCFMVAAYHPGQFNISTEKYVDGILEILNSLFPRKDFLN